MNGASQKIVEACNLTRRLVVCENGELGDIAYFLDTDGDQTDEMDSAFYAMVQWRDDGGWTCLLLSDFERRAPH